MKTNIWAANNVLSVARLGLFNAHPQLMPRLKKEYSYISTPPLGLF